MKKSIYYIGLDVHTKPTEDNEGNKGKNKEWQQISDTNCDLVSLRGNHLTFSH